MNSVRRNVNDVVFEEGKHPGTQKFRSYIRSLVQDGSYEPNFDEKSKKEIVRRIQQHLASLNPHGRFLKRKPNATSSDPKNYLPLSIQYSEVTQKIVKALNKEYRTVKPAAIEKTKVRQEREKANERFLSLISCIAEDKSYNHSDKQKRGEIYREVQEYMGDSRFDKRRIKSALDKEYARIKEKEKIQDEWNNWLKKRKNNEDKRANTAEVGQQSTPANGEREQQTAERVQNQQAMEKKYPKGTKIKMTFDGEVVGYDPPSYLIRYGDQFQEVFDEDDMTKYAILPSVVNNQRNEQSATQSIEQTDVQQDENETEIDAAARNRDSALAAEQARKEEEIESRFHHIHLELASHKTEIEQLKKDRDEISRLQKEFADLRDAINVSNTPSVSDAHSTSPQNHQELGQSEIPSARVGESTEDVATDSRSSSIAIKVEEVEQLQRPQQSQSESQQQQQQQQLQHKQEQLIGTQQRENNELFSRRLDDDDDDEKRPRKRRCGEDIV